MTGSYTNNKYKGKEKQTQGKENNSTSQNAA